MPADGARDVPIIIWFAAPCSLSPSLGKAIFMRFSSVLPICNCEYSDPATLGQVIGFPCSPFRWGGHAHIMAFFYRTDKHEYAKQLIAMYRTTVFE